MAISTLHSLWDTLMAVYIFDFDGTIADSFPLVCNILQTQADKLKCKALQASEITRVKNMHAREMFKYLGVHFWRIPGFTQQLRRAGRERIAEVEIFPGWRETLEYLKSKNHRLGIVSSNSLENIHFLLAKYELSDFFDFVISEKYIFGKGRCLRKIIKRLALKKEEMFYVGDEVRDIEAAQENQIEVIAVAWGFNSIERLQDAKPDLIINSPSELKTHCTRNYFSRNQSHE